MSMASDDNITIHEDEEDMYEHEHEHHHHNLSRLSVCTTNSSKHSLYDNEDDMMMFMSDLSIEGDADEEFSDKDVSGDGSSDSDKETSWMSLPGTPPRIRTRVEGEKDLDCVKEYSSENEAFKGGENKTRKISRRKVVRDKWLDQAWEDKRCKAKAIMDHDEDMMIMEHHNNKSNNININNNLYGRRRSLCMDLEEIKACKDLGFELEMPSGISMSCSALDTPSSGGDSPLASWRISSPGDDPKDVKARLKVWAQAVALESASRLVG